MIKAILWDVDNTLLDFLLSESNSLKSTFKKYGLGVCTDDMVRCYSEINNTYWKMLERGEIDKEGVLVGRFVDFFKNQGIGGVDAKSFTDDYENGLTDTVVFLENARETVEALKGKYKQYAVTNGAYTVQSVKLEKSGLNGILDGAFISDEVGFEKPSREYFDYVLKRIIPCEKDEVLIVGDSLTSDMTGGNNAGIKCCWYNPDRKVYSGELRLDYQINNLNEIFKALEDCADAAEFAKRTVAQ